MIKPSLPGMSLKDTLLARSRDRMYHFSLQGKTIRGALVHAPHLIREMQLNHQTGLLETMILGQAYLAALLVASSLKSDEYICLQIDCAGPLKGLSVEANSHGEVRGYLFNPVLPIDRPLDSFDFSPFIQDGTLTVSRFLPDAKAPYSGKIQLRYANLASDLAEYFGSSEQTPSAFNLSVRFNEQGVLNGAAALMIQAMPGASPQDLDRLSLVLQNMPSLGSVLNDQDPGEFIQTSFQDYAPARHGDKRVEFFCHCNRDLFLQMMNTLPVEDLNSVIQEDIFPLETHCRNCHTAYLLEKSELEAILWKKMN